jgi:DNA-directed RNA polymerase specialized sigma24 family protein
VQEKRADRSEWRTVASRWLRDLAEEVARVAHAKRDLLLRVHRFRLRPEDLEDSYSQATLELLAHVHRGGGFENPLHIANTLELRFLSRVRDRRRALSGRSPAQAALEGAAVLASVGETGIEVPDRAANVEALVLLHHDLRMIGKFATELTADQRLVLGSQLSGERCAEFCERSGWSREKYRKVAQRARTRLRTFMAGTEVVCPGESPSVGSVARTDL